MLIAGHPVGVTCVHPGGIKTAIARNGRGLGQRGQGGARPAVRREAGQDDARAGRRDHRQGRSSRTRPGCSSASTPTLMHHFAKLTGSRYQDVVARVAPARHGSARDRVEPRLPGSAHAARRPASAVEMTKWGDLPALGVRRGLPRRATSTATGSASRPAPPCPARARTTSRRSTRSAWCPPDAAADARLALATFHGPAAAGCEVYVDMTTPPRVGRAHAARGRPRPRRGPRHHRPGVRRRRGRVRRAPGRARLPRRRGRRGAARSCDRVLAAGRAAATRRTTGAARAGSMAGRASRDLTR